MRRRIVYIVVALLTTVVGFTALVFWWFNYSHRPTPDSFQAKIAEYNQLVQAEIPVGSSVTQVIAFLDARKIVHSQYATGLERLEQESALRELAFPAKHEIINGYIGGIVRDADYAPLTSWSVQMKFYFDRQDRLVTHTVTWVGTGI
jgi:hypothetical protein